MFRKSINVSIVILSLQSIPYCQAVSVLCCICDICIGDICSSGFHGATIVQAFENQQDKTTKKSLSVSNSLS